MHPEGRTDASSLILKIRGFKREGIKTSTHPLLMGKTNILNYSISWPLKLSEMQHLWGRRREKVYVGMCEYLYLLKPAISSLPLLS